MEYPLGNHAPRTHSTWKHGQSGRSRSIAWEILLKFIILRGFTIHEGVYQLLQTARFYSSIHYAFTWMVIGSSDTSVILSLPAIAIDFTALDTTLVMPAQDSTRPALLSYSCWHWYSKVILTNVAIGLGKSVVTVVPKPQREAWAIRSNCSYAYIKQSFLPLGHEAFCPSSWKDLLKPDDVWTGADNMEKGRMQSKIRSPRFTLRRGLPTVSRGEGRGRLTSSFRKFRYVRRRAVESKTVQETRLELWQ